MTNGSYKILLRRKKNLLERLFGANENLSESELIKAIKETGFNPAVERQGEVLVGRGYIIYPESSTVYFQDSEYWKPSPELAVEAFNMGGYDALLIENNYH
jgi:hypothetical protein